MPGYPIITGLFAVSVFAMHGSIYLYLKTEGDSAGPRSSLDVGDVLPVPGDVLGSVGLHADQLPVLDGEVSSSTRSCG